MINFELITPDRVVSRQEIDRITLPTAAGEITILPGHEPLVAVLVAGIARLHHGDTQDEVAVSGGFIEVKKGDAVRVLADTAERGHELGLSVIEQAKVRAEQVMKEAARTDESSYVAAVAVMERELARYKVARKYHAARGVPTLDKAVLPEDENPV